jgi:hypothetical protein
VAGGGIFCLEGDWGGLADRTSVRLGLDMLMTVRGDRLIHRNAATRAELEHYLGKWSSGTYRGFPLAYFSYHGSPGYLHLGGGNVSLNELAEIIDGRLTGRILYFGSCGTLDLPGDELRRFVRETGVRAVAGYAADVDWEESAAFDLTLLPSLLKGGSVPALYRQLVERHPYFVRTLGLRMATRSWTSPS